MRRLLLLRHAKSDWSSAVPDHQRQLNPRGMEAAARMGRYIQADGLTPDKVLCSPATRASETWRRVQPSLDPATDADYLEAIYDCGSATALLAIIRQHGGDAHTLMLVGHNPPVEDLADLLSGSGDEAALDSLARKYPAGALAVIDCEIEDWADIEPAAGTLKSFTRPKELAE